MCLSAYDMFKVSAPLNSLVHTNWLERRRKCNLAGAVCVSYFPYLGVSMETELCWWAVLTGGLSSQIQWNPHNSWGQCMQGTFCKRITESSLLQTAAIGETFWAFHVVTWPSGQVGSTVWVCGAQMIIISWGFLIISLWTRLKVPPLVCGLVVFQLQNTWCKLTFTQWNLAAAAGPAGDHQRGCFVLWRPFGPRPSSCRS